MKIILKNEVSHIELWDYESEELSPILNKIFCNPLLFSLGSLKELSMNGFVIEPGILQDVIFDVFKIRIIEDQEGLAESSNRWK